MKEEASHLYHDCFGREMFLGEQALLRLDGKQVQKGLEQEFGRDCRVECSSNPPFFQNASNLSSGLIDASAQLPLVLLCPPAKILVALKQSVELSTHAVLLHVNRAKNTLQFALRRLRSNARLLDDLFKSHKALID